MDVLVSIEGRGHVSLNTVERVIWKAVMIMPIWCVSTGLV